MKHLALSLLLVAALLEAGLPPRAGAQTRDAPITVASKKFTENVLLGEMARLLLEHDGIAAVHRDQLGGTRFLWDGLVSGDVDAYPEYTGTLTQEIFARRPVVDMADLGAALHEQGIGMTPPLGFNNTYALGMDRDRAEALGIRKISDLAGHPALRLGFSNEFMDREDGWPGLQAAYGLGALAARGLDHDLAYRGIASGALDVTDLYTTDAEIDYYDLAVLQDDRGYFPEYQAVFLYRLDLHTRARTVLHRLAGALPESTMVRLNAAVKIERKTETEVAAGFLAATFDWDTMPDVQAPSRAARIWATTVDHLYLVVLSLLAAILVAIPLGIWAAKQPRAAQLILGIVGVIYTIPALALLVFMIPLLGIGGPPALLALFLYSLLPIVRNTYAGLQDIPPALQESARVLGLPPAARLRLVELPLATRAILAGIKTSAVINVGTATLGALIGAGGYGQPILTGIRLDDVGLILEGAVPAALLALAVQGGFEVVERFVLPAGLRTAAPPAHPAGAS